MPTTARTAFVLGGGGLLGAVEAGQALALVEAGLVPDLVIGTSIGAINGAVLAADPGVAGVKELAELWAGLGRSAVFSRSPGRQLATLARTRTALHSAGPLRALLTERFGATRIEDLPVAFHCVAASVEQAREHWFDAGPLVPAVLASCALPGVLPPVEIDGEHFLDGGLVNSIPLARAVRLGATRVFVLHVGRIEQPLRPPRSPWEVAFTAFEISRRHRFHGDLAAYSGEVEVHVLPSGASARSMWSNLRYWDARGVAAGVRAAHAATAAYLERAALRGEDG